MIEWIDSHQTALAWLAASSVVTFVGTVTLVPLLVIRIPADYFSQDRRKRKWLAGRHPAFRYVLLAGKNLFGYVFVAVGLALLLLPGQGLLTIFIGVTLLDFPGKYHVERWVVTRPRVLRSVNWLRRRARRAPLAVDG